MTTARPEDLELGPPAAAGRSRTSLMELTVPWWLFLVTGIGWILVSLLVLQFELETVAAIAYLFGAVMLVAAVDEVFHVSTRPEWRWAHLALAVLFAAGGLWALAYPGQTFRALALLIGWFLLIKGTFGVVAALAYRGTPLWWLTLIAGLAEIGLAFWAAGYPGRSATLLVLWVGFAALFRGLSQVVLAFELHGAGARGAGVAPAG
jgi:uncharacterized membrane protein HdeD (DUF308 family)